MEPLQQFVSVCGVLLLLAAALWFLKRRRLVTLGPQRAAKHLQIIERVALGPQHSLSLIRVDGRSMLVGTGPGVCEIRDVATPL